MVTCDMQGESEKFVVFKNRALPSPRISHGVVIINELKTKALKQTCTQQGSNEKVARHNSKSAK